MRICFAMVVLLAVASVLPAPLAAQGRDTPDRIIALAGVMPKPIGDLADQVDTGKGIAISSIWTGAPDRPFAFRLDGGWITFDPQVQRLCELNADGSCRSEFDINRRNSILFAHFGPQVMAHRGFVRPYAQAGAGLARFSANAPADYADVKTWALSGIVGAGMLVPLTRGSRKVYIDAGARYMYNGSPDYVVDVTPADEDFAYRGRSAGANLAQFYLGIAAGYRSNPR